MTDAASGAFTCLADCPVPALQCPASDAFAAPNATTLRSCSTRGTCLSGTGACACWAGYTGAACERCAFGYALAGGLCLRVPSVAIKALAAAPSTTAQIASIDSVDTGISPLVANYETTVQRAQFGQQPGSGTRRRLQLAASRGDLRTVAVEGAGVGGAVVRARAPAKLAVPTWLVCGVLMGALFVMTVSSVVLLIITQSRSQSLPV